MRDGRTRCWKTFGSRATCNSSALSPLNKSLQISDKTVTIIFFSITTSYRYMFGCALDTSWHVCLASAVCTEDESLKFSLSVLRSLMLVIYLSYIRSSAQELKVWKGLVVVPLDQSRSNYSHSSTTTKFWCFECHPLKMTYISQGSVCLLHEFNCDFIIIVNY